MITMLDSIDVSKLPAGDYAYAGYINGWWITYGSLKWKFPTADVLSITITAAATADCLDVELGDATTAEGLAWIERQLKAGKWRPCIYANVSTLSSILSQLRQVAGELSRIRIWSAHYGHGQHICGPGSCGQLAVNADGTQWTDQHNPMGVDISELRDDFFRAVPGPPPPAPSIPSWETEMMNSLPTLQEGDKDVAGSVFYVHRAQALAKVIGQVKGLVTAAAMATDGDFGAETRAGVEEVQGSFSLTADGVVGPKTWAVLVTGAS